MQRANQIWQEKPDPALYAWGQYNGALEILERVVAIHRMGDNPEGESRVIGRVPDAQPGRGAAG
jgi:hypothetical protein